MSEKNKAILWLLVLFGVGFLAGAIMGWAYCASRCVA